MILLSRPPSAISSIDKAELRAFDFFIHVVAPVLSGSPDDAFWFGPVLQFSRIDPVIWDAVLAISCLFEHPQYSNLVTIGALSEPSSDNSHRLRALGWYGRAISRLRQSFEAGRGDVTVAMLSAVSAGSATKILADADVRFCLFALSSCRITSASPWLFTRTVRNYCGPLPKT